MRRSARIFLYVIVAFPFAATIANASVTVKREPPVVEHKKFNPSQPPKELPHLNPGEAAVTESIFNCAVSTSYHVLHQQSKDSRCDASVKIDSIEVTLQLHVTIWLPDGAPKKLIAHEEGHRQIAESIYKDRADAAAKSAAARLDGRELSGSGRDCDEATRAALNDADTRLCQDYLDQTGGPAGRVGDLYDQITSHGTKYWPAEDEAIRQAFERYAKEQKK